LPTSVIADAIRELAIANRILGNEGVIDAFGHASIRHPTDPNRYFLSRSRSPLFVEPDDIQEYDLDSQPVRTYKLEGYGERVIHGEIYKARPDVNAVVHHHSPAVLPFCMTGVELVPMFHVGATLGLKAPFWDQQDEFGATSLLVVEPEEGASLARALGDNWTVLMRRHGATVAGTNIRQAVFRAISGCLNAQYQLNALAIGKLDRMSDEEAHLASEANLKPKPQSRAWEYWSLRLGDRINFSKQRAAAGSSRSGAARKVAKAAPAKKAAKKVAKKAKVGRRR
jgi:HCOMODA/2-hydroxy-3-carboxy-muconic semialdehyde decarboxylase